MKRALLLFSLWLAGSLVLAEPFVWPSGWPGSAPEEARRGGTFRYWSLGGDGTFNPFVSAGDDRPFHAILLGFGGAPRSWPFHADEWPCDALLHVWNSSDTRLSPVETLLEELCFQGRQELDPDAARAIAHEMQAHIAELQAQIFLPTPNWHLAFDARLRNLFTRELIAEGWGPFELATVYLAD